MGWFCIDNIQGFFEDGVKFCLISTLGTEEPSETIESLFDLASGPYVYPVLVAALATL